MKIIRESSEHPFVTLLRVMHCHLLTLLPLKDSTHLAMTCFSLWTKYKVFIWETLPQIAHTQRVDPNLFRIVDAIKFSGLPLDYSHLAKILSCAGPIVQTILQDAPNRSWKIAAICGLDHPDIANAPHDDVMASYALGGQLICLQKHIQDYCTPFDLNTHDPERKLAKMAATGGHIKILEYLRDLPSYDLWKEQKLLALATHNGQSATIEFLLPIATTPNNEVNLSQLATERGHWLLSDTLALQRLPIANTDDAKIMAKNTCKNGNLKFALSLIKQHSINTRELRESVVEGGHANVFWHFIKHKWLTLRSKFDGGKSIEHILAQSGHLALLKKVLHLKNKAAPNDIFALDDENKSVLDYAAAGKQSHVSLFLTENYDVTRFKAENKSDQSYNL